MADVCVRNISTGGMLLQASRPPATGTYVEIMLLDTSVTARVVWAGERRFGVVARERIRLADFIGPMARDERRSALKSARQARANALVVHRGSDAQASGRAMQFVFLLLCGGAAAAAAAVAAYEALASLRDSLLPHL